MGGVHALNDEVAKRLQEIFELTKTIDERTDDHTTHLENIREDMRALQVASVEQSRAIANNTDRIANSLDRLANKAMDAAVRSPFDWRIAIAALVCLGIITGILILSFTGTSLKAVHGNSNVSVGEK